MTLTNNGVSIIVPGRAAASGNNSLGYDMHVSINTNPGDVAGLPNCTVRASPVGSLPRFTAPYKSIATTLQIFFASCEAFITPPPLSNFLQETVQLNVNKQ
ncbi:MAG: hypothetical protein K2Y23_13455 [Cyanobacteria bacterium]|nr:hypothetical protein [Cyanobacteriota bacterium]